MNTNVLSKCRDFLKAISFSATALAMPALIGENAWAESLLKKSGY